MLFLPHSVDVQRAQILRDLKDGKIDQAAAGERILAIDPDFAGSYLFLGSAHLDAGQLDQAEDMFWTALEHGPCTVSSYLALAELRKQVPDDTLSMQFTQLAMWKLAMADEISEGIADRFRELMPKAELDFGDPASYEILACLIERQMEQMEPPPEPSPRLKPFRLLNELQHEAPEGLERSTLEDILGDPAGCLPVWRAALREWARRPGCISADAIALVIAALGEISGPAILDELLEIITFNDWTLVGHVAWAVWRIGQRFPTETLATFRATRPSATLPARCGIAEQMMLLPSGTSGIEKALMELLEGFTGFAAEEDAAFLLVAVTEALRRHGHKREARDVLNRYEALLHKKGRRWLRQVLESDEGFVPHVDYLGIPELDIEEICIERALMEEADEEEDFDEDLHLPPPVRPGRNDPCWCGSGKKYKKCHLASDEQADQSRGEPGPDESHEDPLIGKVFGDILDCAGDWHNRADLAAAHRLYFDREPEETDADEAVEGGFTEWYVMDFRSPSTGRTLVEEYLRRRGPRLPERERLLVESWRAMRFGMWEVQRVEQGRGVELKNLFEEDTVFVHDVTASGSALQWDCEIARIHRLEDRWLFAGNGFILARPLRKRVMEMVEEGSRAAGQSPAEYVRANSHIWERTLARLHKETRELRLVNAEGDEMEFCQAVYEMLDGQAAATALRAAKMFEDTTSASDAPGVLHFGWLETGVKGPRRSYGHIEIANGALRLECNSRERLEIGRQLVEKHAGAFLRHIEDKFTSVADAMKKMESGDGPPPAGKVPPEVEREIVLKIKAEHYAKWPDEPLPALDGRTPREAARSEAGRRALDDLLRDMENHEERERRQGQPAHDFRKLRKTLGL
jgi:hypothetical protein